MGRGKTVKARTPRLSAAMDGGGSKQQQVSVVPKLLSRNVQGGTFLDAGATFGDGIDEDTPDTWIAETL